MRAKSNTAHWFSISLIQHFSIHLLPCVWSQSCLLFGSVIPEWSRGHFWGTLLPLGIPHIISYLAGMEQFRSEIYLCHCGSVRAQKMQVQMNEVQIVGQIGHVSGTVPTGSAHARSLHGKAQSQWRISQTQWRCSLQQGSWEKEDFYVKRSKKQPGRPQGSGVLARLSPDQALEIKCWYL